FFSSVMLWLLKIMVHIRCLIDQVGHALGDRRAKGPHLVVPKDLLHQFPRLLVPIVDRTGSGGRTAAQAKPALGKDIVPLNGLDDGDDGLLLLGLIEEKAPGRPFEALDYLLSDQ